MPIGSAHVPCSEWPFAGGARLTRIRRTRQARLLKADDSNQLDGVQDDTDTPPVLPSQSFMTTFRAAILAAVLTVVFATVGATQPVGGTANTVTPVFRVRILGDTTTGFSTRVDSYFELRGRLQRTLPAVVVTDDVR